MNFAYYNEFDKKAAAWLRELIKAGLIMDGEVDERSIAEVSKADLGGFIRAHFFAGIGGWDLALQLSGWPEDRPVWTGSCPCQPFSCAGKQKGFDDERDLWPVFSRLIQECRPATVFGEQVSSAIRQGWIDRVCADLETEDYACGFAVLGAHSAGAPHMRQRLYWVGALANNNTGCREHGWPGAVRPEQSAVECGGNADTMADSTGGGLGIDWGARGESGHVDQLREAGSVDNAGRRGTGLGQLPAQPRRDRQDDGLLGAAGIGPVAMAEIANGGGCRGRGHGDPTGDGGEVQATGLGACRAVGKSNSAGLKARDAQPVGEIEMSGQLEKSSTHSFWSDFRAIVCRDGKARRIPTEPALFPLAHGVLERVGLLRGAGNAIVPQVAAGFVRAFMEASA